jgi:hypothetical protein
MAKFGVNYSPTENGTMIHGWGKTLREATTQLADQLRVIRDGVDGGLAEIEKVEEALSEDSGDEASNTMEPPHTDGELPH